MLQQFSRQQAQPQIALRATKYVGFYYVKLGPTPIAAEARHGSIVLQFIRVIAYNNK